MDEDEDCRTNADKLWNDDDCDFQKQLLLKIGDNLFQPTSARGLGSYPLRD